MFDGVLSPLAEPLLVRYSVYFRSVISWVCGILTLFVVTGTAIEYGGFGVAKCAVIVSAHSPDFPRAKLITRRSAFVG